MFISFLVFFSSSREKVKIIRRWSMLQATQLGALRRCKPNAGMGLAGAAERVMQGSICYMRPYALPPLQCTVPLQGEQMSATPCIATGPLAPLLSSPPHDPLVGGLVPPRLFAQRRLTPRGLGTWHANGRSPLSTTMRV